MTSAVTIERYWLQKCGKGNGELFRNLGLAEYSVFRLKVWKYCMEKHVPTPTTEEGWEELIDDLRQTQKKRA